MMGWVALTAPKGTPDEVIETLSDVMGKALQTDEYKEQIQSLGMEYIVLYGDELTSFLADQMEFYEKVCATIEL